MVRNKCNICPWRVLAAYLFVLVASCAHGAEPQLSDGTQWVEKIVSTRASLGPASNDTDAQHARIQQAQLAFFQISLEHPVPSDWLLQDLSTKAWQILLVEEAERLEHEILARVGADESSQSRAMSIDRLHTYLRLCHARRAARLGKTFNRWAPLVFTEGHTHQMSFIGYTESLSDARHERYFKPGARLTVLEFADGAIYGTPRTLLEDPHGMMRDVDVSFDQTKLLFAWKKSDRLDDFHIYEHDQKSNSTSQITRGLGRADYEPAYLPDGDIVFASTRSEQSVPCWWTETSALYRMDGKGRYARRLAIDQVHTLYPQVLSNGRICYTRWDYSDRGQNYPHPVFSMNPDGQGQRVYYGGNSWFPTSLLHTRAIPGSNKVMSVAAGHHTRQHGKLVVLDVSEGRDEGKGMRFIAPSRDVPYERVDVAMQHGDQFRYPYPLSEDELVVSYLPDYGFEPFPKYADSHHYGLYWMRADGARELLHRAPDLGVLRPASFGKRPKPPVIPATVDYTRNTGTYYVRDVYQGVGLKDIPRGEAKKIRVVELDYRAAGVGQTLNHGPGGGSINSAPVAVGNATWDVKRILGDVDIHDDGSARFEVPAMVSTYLQVLNERGHVIQTTRSWDTLLPGEQKACIGCHQKTDANFHTFEKEDTLAWNQPPQILQPFYGETRGFSFEKEIQPILDNHCVSCHNGSDHEAMDLRGIPVSGANMNKRAWTQSYLNLVDAKLVDGNYAADPEGGLVTWISKMSVPTELPPYFSGAAKSPLLKMLDKGHYDVRLNTEENHKFAAWMDLLVPFAGDYREGHSWTDEEMRYYGYFEAKRRHQKAEELSNIAAMLGSPDQLSEPFIRSSYRTVFENETLKIDGKKSFALPKGHSPALIDHLELQVHGLTEPAVLTVTSSGSSQSFNVAADSVLKVRLRNPLLSNELGITVGADGAEVKLIRALGVPVEELPEFDGYRRHIGLCK